RRMMRNVRILCLAAVLYSSGALYAQNVSVPNRLATAARHSIPRLSLPNDFFRGRVLSVDPSLPARLQRALDSQYALTNTKGRHGVGASVIAAGLPQWEGTSGTSYTTDSASVPLDTMMLFEIGSNTKT